MSPSASPGFAPRSSLAVVVLLLSAGSLRGDDRPAPRVGRSPWTTSRFAGTPDPPPPYRVEPAFPKLTFDRPILLDFVPGTRRLVVGEVGGKVVSFPNDPASDRTDLAIDLAAARPGSSALYGLAFHPKFEANRQVFLCYVARNDDPDGTRVSRFVAKADDPLRIDPASEEVLLTFRSGGHNAGCLVFGIDNYLYISTGDSAAPTPPDPYKTGQDIGDLLSSILRIDVDRRDPGRAYRVPPDNPFVATRGARPEVWAYGLRNPWRMAFDRERGDLWVGDVGWELWELIHLVRAGDNCGWSLVEGPQPVRADVARGPTPIVPPVVAHPHSEAASITGGSVYRGRRLGALRGVYVYGDYQSGKVWGLRHDGRAVTWRGELADSGLRLVSFGEDRDGELYLVEYERTNQVYRLAPDAPASARAAFPRRLSETGLFASTKDHAPAPGVVPYAINAELWADGARADRLMGIPGDGRAEVDAAGRWRLPDGAVLARTVSLDLVEGDPASRRRVETQVLHREAGSWRPYSYLWDDSQTDATLADSAGATRTFTVRDAAAPGGSREHAYRVAARSECALCHNPWVETSNVVYGRQSASPLAMSTEQLNRGDQLRRLESLGLVAKAPSPATSPHLADPRDEAAPLDLRARSYLQANCAHCHQLGAGGSANIFLAARTPLAETQTLDAAPLQGSFGLPDARVIAAGEPERSVLYYRMSKLGSGRMPRVGSSRVDAAGTRLIADWIASLPRSGSSRTPAEIDAALSRLADPKSPPSARREAISLLIGSTRGALALVRRIDAGSIPLPVAREAAASARATAGPEVLDLLERFLPESERSRRLGDAIDVAALLARPGDAARGRALFRAGGAASCRSCHRAEGEGVEIGPPLDGIGSKYPRPELLDQILNPSRVVDPKYATVAVATRDGRTLSGVLIEESPRELVLRDATGRTTRLPLSEVEDRRRDPKSLMPDALLSGLTADQAADLLEYLAHLKADGPAPRPITIP